MINNIRKLNVVIYVKGGKESEIRNARTCNAHIIVFFRITKLYCHLNLLYIWKLMVTTY